MVPILSLLIYNTIAYACTLTIHYKGTSSNYVGPLFSIAVLNVYITGRDLFIPNECLKNE